LNTRIYLPACRCAGPTTPAFPSARTTENRIGKPVDNYWAGKFGDAQIGPIYLGGLGTLCPAVRLHRLRDHRPEHAGLGELGSIEFMRQLPWLALEPPPPKYGLSIPPLNEGGWWLMAGLLPDRLDLPVVARTYKRAKALGMGQHMTWAFASAIWLYLVLGLIRRC
jgi:photosynthetic reaction center M subunit